MKGVFVLVRRGRFVGNSGERGGSIGIVDERRSSCSQGGDASKEAVKEVWGSFGCRTWEGGASKKLVSRGSKKKKHAEEKSPEVSLRREMVSRGGNV